MAFGITEVNYALKRIYPKFPPQNIASWKHPFLSMVTKEDGWVGEENFKQGLEYGNPQAIGGDFTKAQAVTGSTIGVAFDVPRRWKFGFATINGKAVVATSKDEGAFFRAVKRETDNGIRSFGDRLAVEALCGDGTGTLANVAVSGVSGNVITLASKWHARRFKQGMALEFSTSGLLAGLRTYSTAPKVTVVNYRTGKITVDNLALVTGVTDGDYIAAAGDFETGAHGVAAWIPLTEPNDTYFGVTRGSNPTMLSGHRLDSTTASNSIKENAQDLAALGLTTGAYFDTGLLSPLNWNRLQKDIDAQVKVDAGEGKFGFSYIEQAIPSGMIKWYPDPDMEDDRGYMLTLASWMIRHAYGFPHLNEDDGNSALRSSTADAIEVRLRSAGNVFCLAPGLNGVFPITPPA